MSKAKILLILTVYKIMSSSEASPSSMKPKLQNESLLASPKIGPDETNQSSKTNNSSRIIGGIRAERGEFPFIVSLQAILNRQHFCGGSLIHSTKVLTACHCLAHDESWIHGFSLMKPYNILIHAGTENIHPLYDEGQVTPGKYVHIHPQCSSYRGWVYDLGIIITYNRFTPNARTLEPLGSLDITTKYVDQLIRERADCTAAGWGYTESGTTYYLMKLQLELVPTYECHLLVQETVGPLLQSSLIFDPSNQLCVLGRGEGHGSSPNRGDSGGPLICDGHLVAATSWLIKPAQFRSPNVFARVDSGLEWIMSTEGKGESITIATNYRLTVGPTLLTLAIYKYTNYYSYVDLQS